MTTYRKRCEHCQHAYDATLDRSRFCSDVCRATAYKAAQRVKLTTSLDLLRRMSAALSAGADAQALAELRREAERLLN